MREGLRYVWTTPRLRWPLVLMAIVYTLSFNFSVLLPLLARFAFGGGAALYAQLLSAMGAGSLVGALVMANRRRPSPQVLAWAAAAWARRWWRRRGAPTSAWPSASSPAIGFASMVFMATGNTMMQVASAPSMRGRVMAVYAMVFLGSTPIGGPLMGWLSEWAGPALRLRRRRRGRGGERPRRRCGSCTRWGARGRVPVLLRRLAAAEPEPAPAPAETPAVEEPLSA